MSRRLTLVCLLVGGIALLTITHPRRTLTTLLVTPVVVAIALAFGRRLRRATTGVQDQRAEAMGTALGCTVMDLQIVNLREELGPWYRSLGYAEVGTAPYQHRSTKRPCHLVKMSKALV